MTHHVYLLWRGSTTVSLTGIVGGIEAYVQYDAGTPVVLVRIGSHLFLAR